MWMSQLARNTMAADKRIGSHKDSKVTIGTSSRYARARPRYVSAGRCFGSAAGGFDTACRVSDGRSAI
jgi:hypothetical protein